MPAFLSTFLGIAAVVLVYAIVATVCRYTGTPSGDQAPLLGP